MIDDRTPNLNLPKPSVGNTLLEDLPRLRSAFDTLDTVVGGKQDALGFTPLNANQKGANGGVCELTGDGFVPSIRLPSYVDDVLEFANRAAFPATGEAGKIYLALDTNGQWRWTGSTYVQITASPGTTDAVPEGSVNLYFTPERARAAQVPATAVTPGLVSVGSGLAVDVNGKISLDAGTSFTESLIPIASNGQTDFVVDGGYTAASVQVLLNGVELLRNDDFFATDGVNLTLAQGVNTGDKLLLRSWKAFLNIGPVSIPGAPVNTLPANGSTLTSLTTTFSGGAFLAPDGATHAATQVQLGTSAGFGTIALDTGALAAATSVSVNLSTLTMNTAYFWRMRYQSSGGQWSAWSTPTTFVMPAAVPSYIPEPTPTPEIGSALEGGYYGGMIWNQVTQSATGTIIQTGSKVFSVPDQTSSPMFYLGQQIEIRSRADPSNKMAGTVVFAAGTNLTVNVTSTSGSGTFSDWSIMARYRLIVAPKSGGQFPVRALTSSSGTYQSLTEGASGGLLGDGVSSTTLVANLTLNQYSDWYIPARDELEVLYRNLKPDTSTNNTSSRTVSQFNSNYTQNGSYGDNSTSQGVNINSDPVGSGYTTTAPSQTSATIFRDGGAEAFELAEYWTITYSSPNTAWTMSFANGRQLSTTMVSTTSTIRARAVRRSII